MGYFKDDQHFYQVYEEFLKRVLADPSVGSKLAKSNVKIRFNYTDPEATILLNFSDPPAEGMYGSYELGNSGAEADVTMTQSADFSHRFWQGKENAVTSLASGKIKASGEIQKAMALVTAIRPTFLMYKNVLKDLGYADMIID
ncbi:MAG: SCP2 sterol-binding domain-containing protein [Candidatus Hydrogenedentota bacterium]|nr:MAG: SCP2 sterol-binding domain-containing protein [Candidatus Hydrogenedentota bacterium]